MADQITLYTSDSPAKHLTVSRAVLAAHSTVFRDLLSIPTSAPDVSDPAHKDCSVAVAVAETEAEIKPFLSILTGEFDEPLELSEHEWKDVARLADKYDSKVVRLVIENNVRTLSNDESAPFALFLACNTHDVALRTDSAFRVLRSEESTIWSEKKRSELSDQIERRMVEWKGMLREHAVKAGNRSPPDDFDACYKGECTESTAELAWLRGIRMSLALGTTTFKYYYSPFYRGVLAAAQQRGSKLCGSHRDELGKECQRFEEKYYRRTAPAFPS